MNLRNTPSHVLSKAENKTIKDILGENRISICTTYAQIYVTSKSEQDWQIVGTGALCLTHDFQLNTFILVLIDADRIIWECELTNYADYMWVSKKFHLLKLDQLMGINFICHLEAQHFQYKLVRTLEYINTTHLAKNIVRKSETLPKMSNTKYNTLIKSENGSRSPMARGRSCIKKCYRKLVNKTKFEYTEFTTESRSSSPTSEEKEKIYQTLSDIRQLQIRYCPCHA
ncbi:Wiskott-Aldrich syndrome protein-like isoform X1 [Oopsacas minuta]|uniref:Wiskott-Aldrich syndrome protein-like isoform X1 n=1 Tax=Oopsacas minuta TaxID=111878 RepID=A0AAV7KDT5_9METZ|nr:Wiskott-Aldrich syndrome protein-like isoform X1 [Oopsacas minuta]